MSKTEYRFVSRDGKLATGWRPLPKEGVSAATRRLTDAERKRLGEKFSLEMK